jgi:hypothetical protein
MEILHLDLKLVQGSDRVEFRYFWDNPNDAQSPQTSRLLSELEERRKKADTHYYTRLPEDYAKTGQAGRGRQWQKYDRCSVVRSLGVSSDFPTRQ